MALDNILLFFKRKEGVFPVIINIAIVENLYKS